MDIDPEKLEAIRQLVVSAQGGNPEAEQTLNKFLRFDSNIERTNLPKRQDVKLVTFYDYAAKSFFPNIKNNPFSDLVESVTVAFMAKGGEKAKQVVEIFKQTPDIVGLEGLQEQQRGFIDKALGRGKKE